MKWKFWKREQAKDETVLQIVDAISTTSLSTHKDYYVKAQTSEKALELIKKLREENTK